MTNEERKPRAPSVDVPLDKSLELQEKLGANAGRVSAKPQRLGPIAKKVLATYARS